jgi:hypothetical protein
MFRKPLAFWRASAASEEAACFAWLPACCATSAILEAASPALARISWDPPTPAGETLDGAEDDAELPEREEFWLFIRSPPLLNFLQYLLCVWVSLAVRLIRKIRSFGVVTKVR